MFNKYTEKELEDFVDYEVKMILYVSLGLTPTVINNKDFSLSITYYLKDGGLYERLFPIYNTKLKNHSSYTKLKEQVEAVYKLSNNPFSEVRYQLTTEVVKTSREFEAYAGSLERELSSLFSVLIEKHILG